MARIRHTGKCGLASLVVGLVLLSCSEREISGWSIPEAPAETLSQVEVGTETSAITILISFPENHDRAEGFEQRAMLTVGEQVHNAILDESGRFVIEFEPLQAGRRAELVLHLGYCHKQNPDVCHIDLPSIGVVQTGTADGHVEIGYRPPLPML